MSKAKEDKKMGLEESKEIVNEIITHKNDVDIVYGARIIRPYPIDNKKIQAIETVLQELERYKRLAEANLKDNEEFKNNMCEHRCILKSKLQKIQENSIPKKKIEYKIVELKLYRKYAIKYNNTAEANKTSIGINILQELLEEK